ncbi:variable surface lipoprotein, partial [Mycoplasmopsis bovis]|uniref:variable surface lipoprotein n=1 Tax=Mycoplasmopsis bovis TaxID=28903 RepID=UPI003D2746CF
MKKNKLLLSLGSLSIFSAIPFVAAKCDNTETKDNNSSKEPGTTDPATTSSFVTFSLANLFSSSLTLSLSLSKSTLTFSFSVVPGSVV